MQHVAPAVAGGKQRASGTLLPELARELGLRDDVVVAAGGGDNAASAVGIGATDPGDGFLSLGTSGVLCVIGGPLPAESGVRDACVLPRDSRQMASDERRAVGGELPALGLQTDLDQ
ncbi:Xylulose kinase [Candidatus Burkholderia pumila]|uniref:Xylulose kinase n=1 Tax=Candidatus Burkholderia pumila TaxID=1090375 RepID=A0ABR5HMB3_9BURK|nr:Xylulose kinase [Candidatus Burkholderia pumila]